MKDNKPLIPILLISFLLVLFGCSSFFSFSWKTKKKVKTPAGTNAPVTERSGEEIKHPPRNTDIPSRGSVKAGRKGIELQIARLEQTSPDGLARFMTRLSEHGVRVIYFRVFQNPGDRFFRILPAQAKAGVYFETTRAPVVSNLLPLVCRIAHEKNIRVFAWMNTLKAGFLECTGAKRIYKYLPDRDELVQTKAWSPLDPGVRATLAGLFSELARTPIDGILVQDDFILHYNEDLSGFTRRRFMDATGKEAFSPDDLYETGYSEDGKRVVKAYTPLFWEWTRWKSEVLAGFLKELKGAVKRVRPSVRFAVDINYEALSAPKNALAWYSRAIPTLEEIVRPDCYAIMSYQRQMREELERPESEILAFIRGMVSSAMRMIPDPNRWIFKVQTIDWKTRRPIAPGEIKATLKTIASSGTVRVCLMPFIPALLQDNYLARLESPVSPPGKSAD